MEGNAPSIPEFCVNNCGFYGNPIYNNMCSQCFKLSKGQDNSKTDENDGASDQMVVANESNSSRANVDVSFRQKAEEGETMSDSGIEVAQANSQPESLQKEGVLSYQVPPTESTPAVLQVSDPPGIAESMAPTRPVQVNKALCFKCRVKLPLVKQTTNKCKCGYIFCDSHKIPDQHNCDFDFKKQGRELLMKNNPKINDHPKGGRSFTRIDT